MTFLNRCSARSFNGRIQFATAVAMVWFFCSPCGAAEPSELDAWRAHRLERLTAPDGWLTLVGLHWLDAGDQTIGTAEDNRLVLPKGPRRLGVISWDKTSGDIFLTLDTDAGATVEGTTVNGKVKLSDSEEAPTLLKVDTLTLQLLTRGDRKALRVRDSNAATRLHFTGIDSFTEDSTWRIEARWEPFLPPHTLKIQNIVGTVSDEAVPGKAIFERDGKTYELCPIQEAGDDRLFFIFSDQTSGNETYGAGRFLFTDTPKDGKLVLDFNRAINPPCAFTAFATCPLPPRQNRLTLPVAAGEKKPQGHP